MTPESRIRLWLIIFLAGLVASGVTAFPLVLEIRLVDGLLDNGWLDRVRAGLEATDRDHPFLFYGTDWLAFAHLVIGLAFIGPLRDPVRNVWVIQWAMLCCVAVIPLALIAGPIRGIPLWWQLVDISFGVLGIIPLAIVHREIKKLAGPPHQCATGPATPSVR